MKLFRTRSFLASLLFVLAACSPKGLAIGGSTGGVENVGMGGVAVGSGGNSGGGSLLGTGGVLSSGGALAGTGGLLGSGGLVGSGGRPGSGGSGSGGLSADGGMTSRGGAGGAGAGGNAICGGTSLIAREAHNYAFSSTLTFPPVVVAPKTDLTFDWSGVTRSFVGHALDTKKDLNTILLFSWKLTPSEFQTRLNADSLKQRDLVILPLQYTTDGSGTSARLLAFTNNGDPTAATILSYMDPVAYPPASHTYTLMVASGSVLGEGTRMIQAIQVDPNSTNTTVKMTSDSTGLTYSVDLHSLTPTLVPAGRAAITIDYGQLTKNALGNEWIASNITTALVGHYTGSPTELESKFLDLELIAAKYFYGEITAGTKAVLSKLKTSAGESFPGIDDTGTWVMALRCGGCRNPAPWYLTVLKVCTP